MSAKKPKPKTGAERQAAYAANGRSIAFVLSDELAIEKLAQLEAKHGGVKAAITRALRGARVS
jgi:hypothetical protein